jgi:hypothetical protein
MWRAAAAALGVIAALGCSRDPAPGQPAPTKENSVTTDIPAPQTPIDAAATLPLMFEELTLATTLDEVIALAAARDWRHNATPHSNADQIVTVFTTREHPVKRFKLTFEASRLIGIAIDYRAPDPARLAIRARYPRSRQGDGGWYLGDEAGQQLVFVDEAGGHLRVLMTGMLHDRNEAEALLRQAFPP